MFENIEKVLTITLLAIELKLDGEDEQVKKGKKICLDETMVKKPELKHSSSSQLLFKDFAKPFTECLSEIEGTPT